MPERKLGSADLLAAVVLAALTLTVFWMLRDYGPESAIRRYHAAVMARDPGKLQQSALQDIDSDANRILVASVNELLTSGARFRVLDVERTPTEVRAIVEYVFPTRRIPMLWVVAKRQGLWRVDANQTVFNLRRRLF